MNENARALMRAGGALALAPVVLLAACTHAGVRPVMVGNDNGIANGCSELAQVALTESDGLPVHVAPRRSAATTGTLSAGHPLWICQRSAGGRWYGVIFQPEERMDDYFQCGLSHPQPRRVYRGPCRSGWVESARVWLAAG